jgi:hypothetical protein
MHLRYQELSSLKQSLITAYDVMLGRVGGLGKVRNLMARIENHIKTGSQYSQKDVFEFVENLALLEDTDQVNICLDLTPSFFTVLLREPSIVPLFLPIYEHFVDSRNYSWSHAETVASAMQVLFQSEVVMSADRAYALDLAIRAAVYMNRFAAMATCEAMIKSIRDEALGLRIGVVLSKNRESFIAEIDPADCQSESIRQALRQIRHN